MELPIVRFFYPFTFSCIYVLIPNYNEFILYLLHKYSKYCIEFYFFVDSFLFILSSVFFSALQASSERLLWLACF